MKALLIVLFCLTLISCKKDKFNSVPQIAFKSVSRNFLNNIPNTVVPEIIFSITDKEGDIGLTDNKDTAFIFLKSLLNGRSDSLPFPHLNTASKENFNAEVRASINKVLECRSLPGNPPPVHIDTLYFEIYIKDFAKNKSNVITTTDPVFYECQ